MDVTVTLFGPTLFTSSKYNDQAFKKLAKTPSPNAGPGFDPDRGNWVLPAVAGSSNATAKIPRAPQPRPSTAK